MATFKAAINGTTLHYASDGDEHAPALVLANSLGADHTMWGPQVAALGRAFRVIRYDTRGHGRSGISPGPYTIELLGTDVVALLDHLRIERAAFCGISLGGAVGQWLGLNATNRVSRLVLANTAAKFGTIDAWNQRIAAVNAGGVAAIADAVLGRWFTPAFAQREPAIVAHVRATLVHQSAAGYVAQCVAVRDVDFRDALGTIAIPALVIAGTHDTSTSPADAAFLARQIPGARYLELDTAHLSNLEAPMDFNAAVLAFLQEPA